MFHLDNIRKKFDTDVVEMYPERKIYILLDLVEKSWKRNKQEGNKYEIIMISSVGIITNNF
jgi:hypothetical protein